MGLSKIGRFWISKQNYHKKWCFCLPACQIRPNWNIRAFDLFGFGSLKGWQPGTGCFLLYLYRSQHFKQCSGGLILVKIVVSGIKGEGPASDMGPLITPYHTFIWITVHKDTTSRIHCQVTKVELQNVLLMELGQAGILAISPFWNTLAVARFRKKFSTLCSLLNSAPYIGWWIQHPCAFSAPSCTRVRKTVSQTFLTLWPKLFVSNPVID